MASFRFDIDRGTEPGAVDPFSQGDITPDVRLIISDVVTREEAITLISRLRDRFLEVDWPAA